MEFYDKRLSKLVFKYSPLGIIGDELDDWIVSTKTSTLDFNDTYAYSKLSYWTLREVSCIPIYRNQEWFNEAYYKLRDFWNTILEWRNKGLTKLENHIEYEKQKKREAKSNKKPKTENVYIDLNLNIFNFNPNHRETNVDNVEDYIFSDELPQKQKKDTSKKAIKKSSNKKKTKKSDNISVSDDDSFDDFKFSDE